MQGKFIGDLCASTGFFLIFLLYPSASVTTFQFFVCDRFGGEGETGYRFLLKDYTVDCNGVLYNGWKIFIYMMIASYPIGIPTFYMLQLYGNRHHLDRLRRFEIEKEDIEAEKKARRNTVSELTISEFERAELMRLLEEAEVERVEKKAVHIDRNLPTAVKKLTTGYSRQCFWFEVFECIRKIALVGIPVVFEPGTVEQRTLGLIICFITSALIALLQPYQEPNNNNLAILCQFMIFFCLIAGMVTQIQPDSPGIDALLCSVIISLFVMAISLEVLQGRSINEYLTYLVGFDQEMEDGRPKNKSIWDPLCAVIQVIAKAVGRCCGRCKKRLDRFLGVADPNEEVEEARKQRMELHPELDHRHRMDSWRNSKTFKDEDFGLMAQIDEVEKEGKNEGKTADQKAEMMIGRLDEGIPGGDGGGGEGRVRAGGGGGGGGGRTGGGGGGRTGGGGGRKGGNIVRGTGPMGVAEVDNFLHPERFGIEIAIGDLKRSASIAAKRCAKSLSNLVGATKAEMEKDLKRIAADWPVVTPRGRHLTERYDAVQPGGAQLANSKDSLIYSSNQVFEAQRELRGIAFLSGAEYQDDVSAYGRQRPEGAAQWKDLVSSITKGTMATAHSLRILQKVLDSFPEEDDTTNVLRDMPASHPHRKLITELGLASAAASSSLRNLLSLAVAAGADPSVAPWSVYHEVKADLGRKMSIRVQGPTSAHGKAQPNDDTDQSGDTTPSDSFRPNKPSTNRSGRMSALDQRLAAVAARGKTGLELDTSKAIAARPAVSSRSERSDSSDPPSSNRGMIMNRKLKIDERLAAARKAARDGKAALDDKPRIGARVEKPRLPLLASRRPSTEGGALSHASSGGGSWWDGLLGSSQRVDETAQLDPVLASSARSGGDESFKRQASSPSSPSRTHLALARMQAKQVGAASKDEMQFRSAQACPPPPGSGIQILTSSPSAKLVAAQSPANQISRDRDDDRQDEAQFATVDKPPSEREKMRELRRSKEQGSSTPPSRISFDALEARDEEDGSGVGLSSPQPLPAVKRGKSPLSAKRAGKSPASASKFSC